MVQIRRRVLKERSEENNNNGDKEDEIDFSTKKPQIFVDFLLNIQQTKKGGFAFTDDQIRDQTLTLLNGVSCHLHNFLIQFRLFYINFL